MSDANDAAPSTPMSGVPRTRSRGRRVLVAVMLVVLSLLASELAARALYAALGRPYDAEASRRQIESMAAKFNAKDRAAELADGGARTEAGEIVQHPYLGWENLGKNVHLAENAAYFRTPEAVEAFDVYMFGGSVALGLSGAGTDRLAALIAADPRFAGRSVVIHNYGRGAYKQPQQVMFLSYLLNLGHRPDAVIEVDGFNEVAIGWNNAVAKVHPLHPDSSHWGTTARGQRLGWPLVERLYLAKAAQERVDAFGPWALSTGIWKSCVLGSLAVQRMSALKRQSYATYERVVEQLHGAADDPVLRGPSFEPGVLPGFGLIVRGWEESSRILHGICREHSIPYLHVLQPTLFDEGSKTLTAAEIANSAMPDAWVEGVRKGYPLLRLAGLRLQAAGVPFCDASGVFRDVENDVYTDGCHFGKEGNLLFASAIARGFLAALEARR
jgi:hypothetical protein